MLSIQETNLAAHDKRIQEAKANNNEPAFINEMEAARITLESIKEADSETYEKYSYLMNEEFK
jgi:hypothetical protein